MLQSRCAARRNRRKRRPLGGKNADILLAPIALVLKDSMMGEITGDMAASVGSSSAVRILIPTERAAHTLPARRA